MGIICGIPFLIFLILERRGISPDIFYEKLVGTLLGYSKIEYNFLTSPLWFLFCLFMVEAIASCLPRLGQMRKAALLIATGALGVIFFRPAVDLPFGLAGVPAAVLFFGLGIAISQKIDSLTKREILKSIFPVAAIFTLALLYSSNEISISEGKLGEGFWIFLNIAAALSGSYLIYCASYHIAVDGEISKKLTSFLGTYGLPVIGFNYWINSLISQISGGIATKHWIFSFFVQLFLLYGITYITAKTDVLACQLIGGRWRPKIRSAK
jgi:acyltransferase